MNDEVSAGKILGITPKDFIEATKEAITLVEKGEYITAYISEQVVCITFILALSENEFPHEDNVSIASSIMKLLRLDYPRFFDEGNSNE